MSSLLNLAAEQARSAEEAGEEAVGAVLAKGDESIAVSHHRVKSDNDPVAHATMDCVRRAGRRIDYPELTLFLTSAPCMMCAGAILQFGIGRVVIGTQPSNNEIIDLLRKKDVSVEVIKL
ncbi:MAG: nucleoside deaminase [Gammaproteobacteria bacterium]|nr:nucleoside deaminase [Gammaproteobacteria bacterium]